MTPEAAIAALDRAIEQSGQTVELRRVVGKAPNQLATSVNIRAMVRKFTTTELMDGVTQADRKVVISPTALAKTQWPGGVAPDYLVDAALPQNVMDRFVIDGRLFNLAFANPIKIADVLVRMELTVRG